LFNPWFYCDERLQIVVAVCLVSGTEQWLFGCKARKCAPNQKRGKGAMGMMFATATEPIPDTFGLPVYKITKTIEERVGDEVRILCGHEMFGQTVWTHIVIMEATDLAASSSRCQQISMRPKQHLLRLGG
jgi:hypothetical protein